MMIKASYRSLSLSPSNLLSGVLLLVLGSLTLSSLIPLWSEDPSLGHSPILCLIAIALLWNKRQDFTTITPGSRLSGVVFVSSVLVHIVSNWADTVFLKPLSFFGIVSGAAGLLLGQPAFRSTAIALGLLTFTAPWPTTVVEKLSFPLQLFSSSYAALFAGLLGLPIHREGVEIHVLNGEGTKAIYSILVAQKCSGLTSLNVLLALGYLISVISPIRWWARCLLVSIVPPLALIANSVRLTLILFTGAHYGSKAAQWIHDNEQPVLVFFCSIGLLGLRTLLIQWDKSSEGQGKTDAASTELS